MSAKTSQRIEFPGAFFKFFGMSFSTMVLSAAVSAVVATASVMRIGWLITGSNFAALAGGISTAVWFQAPFGTFSIEQIGFLFQSADLLPYLTGQETKTPRKGFMYFSDDGDLVAVRFDNWKVVFMEQRVQGTLQLWAEPFVALRFPKLFNLRTDPFERADITSNTYWDWVLDSGILVLTASMVVGQFLETFKESPPRQHAASFTIDQAVAKLEASLTHGQ